MADGDLTASDRQYAAGGFYRVVAAHVASLPGDNPELVHAAGLLASYDHGPGRRPDISLNGDDEDTADVIGELLDDHVMDSNEDTADTEDGTDCCDVGHLDGPVLSRESPAAFLHDLVLAAGAWLAQDATVSRSTGSRETDLRPRRVQTFRAPGGRSGPFGTDWRVSQQGGGAVEDAGR